MAADGRLSLDKLSGAGAAAGDAPVWTGTRWKPGAATGWNPEAVIVYGSAITFTNVLPPGLRVPTAVTLTAVYLRAGTAPSGSALTVDVVRGGSTIATVSIAAGSTSGSSTGLSVALAAGEVLTFDVTAVGSTNPGSDVAVELVTA